MELKIRLLLLLCACVFITACGGGGSSSEINNANEVTPAADTSTDSSTDSSASGSDPLGAVGTQEEEQDRLFASLTENVISPRYGQLRDEAESLEEAINAYCADPVNGDTAILESAWADAMQAWQAISVVRFGPIEEEARRLRLQFFEGSGNAVVNDVLALLESAEVLSEDLIAESPFSTQGLPAIEYILFELQGLDESVDGVRRCDMISAVAANLVTIADELDLAWAEGGDWRLDFENATGEFSSRLDVLQEVLESIVGELEFVVGDKIINPLNFGETVAESFRSRVSGDNIETNLAALQALFEIDDEDSSYGLQDYLDRAHEVDGILVPLIAELTSALEEIGPLTTNFDDVIAGQAEGDLDGLNTALQEMLALILAAALAIGLELGL